MTSSISQTRERLEPGRELDVLIAVRIFGWESAGEKQMWSIPENPDGETEPDGTEWMGQLPPERRRHPEEHLFLPHYSTHMAAAWSVVARVQALHPGWRFMLLGGDRSFGYNRVGDDFVVNKTIIDRFGWRASFFGEEDPTVNYGERHADEWAATAPHAICLAALVAIPVLTEMKDV